MLETKPKKEHAKCHPTVSEGKSIYSLFSNGHTRMKGKKPPIRYVNYKMGDNSAQFQSLHIAIHGVEFVCTRREVLLGRMKWDEWQTCEREVQILSHLASCCMKRALDRQWWTNHLSSKRMKCNIFHKKEIKR